jgi:hypothetical protein
VRERLEKAQNHYKRQYNRNHRELEFHTEDWVWLRLLHRPVTSVNVVSRGKLGPGAEVLWTISSAPTSCCCRRVPIKHISYVRAGGVIVPIDLT